MVKAGQFRDDLYYRLSATAIVVPPLRARSDALEALTAHYAAHYNHLFGKRIQFISRRALSALKAYDWPGNVREFAHAIQSAVMLTDGERLELQSLPEHLVHSAEAEGQSLPESEGEGRLAPDVEAVPAAAWPKPDGGGNPRPVPPVQ